MVFRKNIKKILPFIFVFILILSSPALADGDISVKNWQIKSEIIDDGSLEVVEDITFYFNSDFNGVYKDIVLDGIDDIENVQIQEIKPEEVNYKKVDSAHNGDKNVFTIDKEDNTLKIKIFSPSEYEEKTFRFSYKLLNVVNTYNDISEFTYKFVGDENQSYIENLDIDILLPKKINDQVKMFGHGYRGNSINFKGDRIVNIQGSKIPSESLVEGRILMPVDFVDNSELTSDEDVLDILLKQEESYKQQEERSRTIKAKRKKGVDSLTFILIPLGFLLLLFAYIKNKHNTEPYEDNLTGSLIVLPPAIITLVSRMPFDVDMIMTSIYHLSQTGYLSIEECGSFTKGSYGEEFTNFKISLLDGDRDKLLSHENFLLDWLFKTIAQGDHLTMEDLSKYTDKQGSKFIDDFPKFCSLVKQDALDIGIKDDSLKKLGVFTIVTSIVFIVLGIFNLIIYRNILKGIVLIAQFLGLLILGIELTQRLTNLGHIQYTKLMDFKKDVLKERINITDERLLIIATALGIKSEQLLKFEKNFDSNHTDTSLFPSWIYIYFLMDEDSNSVFAQSLSTSSNMESSYIDTGGNFSSGGGTGAGGGGVGGF